MITGLAAQHTAWGHSKIWAMARHRGHQVSMSTKAWVMDDASLLLKADLSARTSPTRPDP